MRTGARLEDGEWVIDDTKSGSTLERSDGSPSTPEAHHRASAAHMTWKLNGNRTVILL